MLTGRFLCDSCQEILLCQELRLCCGCTDILCSMCQFSKCDGATSNDIFHKTRKLEWIMNKSHTTVQDQNHGFAKFGETTKRLKRNPAVPMEPKLKQLEICTTAVSRALAINEELGKRVKSDIRTAMMHMIYKFSRMIKKKEKKLQEKLKRMCKARNNQLCNILQNITAIDSLLRQSQRRNVPHARSVESFDDLESICLENLNVMRLMISFGYAVDSRMRFNPLSENDMKKALHGLPDLGVLQVQNESHDAQFPGLDVMSLNSESTHVVVDANEERISTDEDSIGETDRDFGEYHVGTSLVKVLPANGDNVTSEEGYGYVDAGGIVPKETLMTTTLEPQKTEKPNLLQRLPIAFRKNFLPSFTNSTAPSDDVLTVSSSQPRPKASGESNNSGWANRVGRKSTELACESGGASETVPGRNKRVKRFFKKYSHKVEPGNSTQDITRDSGETVTDSNTNTSQRYSSIKSSDAIIKVPKHVFRNVGFSAQHQTRVTPQTIHGNNKTDKTNDQHLLIAQVDPFSHTPKSEHSEARLHGPDKAKESRRHRAGLFEKNNQSDYAFIDLKSTTL